MNEEITLASLIERYGEPVMQFKPYGEFNPEDIELGDVPIELAIFKLEKHVSAFIVWNNFGSDRWYPNRGERFVIRELLKINTDLESENLKLREDAAQVFIEELVINSGGMDASLNCQPFTRVMAKWALESFKAASVTNWTPNFIALDFGLAGEERYTMTIQRMFANSPEKMAAAYRNAMEAFEKWWRLPNDQRTIEAIEPAMSRCLDLLEGKVL